MRTIINRIQDTRYKIQYMAGVKDFVPDRKVAVEIAGRRRDGARTQTGISVFR
jgi:hypothetical protein